MARTLLSKGLILVSGIHFCINNLCRADSEYVVKMIGYCVEQHNSILILERMPRGSLFARLYGNPGLGWKDRVRIAVGVARGLHYLHVSHDPPVIHCDIRPKNILLGENFEVKLANFKQAIQLPHREFLYVWDEHARGTIGYIDPLYSASHRATISVDIYSLGVVLLQLVTGRPGEGYAPHFEQLGIWAPMKIAEGRPLSYLAQTSMPDYNETSVNMMTELGLQCVIQNDTRPDISFVLQSLIDIQTDLPSGSGA